MVTRRFTSAALAAGVATAVGVTLFTTGAQSAGAAVADDDLRGKALQDYTIDTGRSGPSVGDRYVFSERLFDEDNKRVGTLAATCDVTYVNRSSSGRVKNALSHCTGTFRLDDGQITVAGTITRTAKSAVLAITGGTGRYDDAAGEVALKFVNDKRTNYDFDFENKRGGTIVG
ncbi:hypothetical protein GCM10009547_24590 [Sporichthya brevicatena]|uniref:Allene oxide cyclase barrel-like domain-containing protein n=1 Tax=Sporichthya brevicatena TaxID=171442 RepID=A0ABN1GVV1_9ACTN